MAGVKGCSGRKSKFEEDMLMDVLNLSVKTIKQFLEDTNISLEKRVAIAKDFSIKKIPTKVDADISSQITLMPIIEKNGEPLEHNVGD